MAAIYHINRKATRQRDSNFVDAVIFGAANDAAAAAIAAIFDTYQASQRVSLTKAYLRSHVTESHPVGTRKTVKAVTLSATDQVYRVNLRNLAATATDDHIVALLTGAAGPGTGPAVAALSAPPKQPNSGSAIVVVQSTIATLR